MINDLRAVILSADSSLDNKNNLPSCFTLTTGAISLLEYDIRMWNILGLKNNNITLIISRGGGMEYEVY